MRKRVCCIAALYIILLGVFSAMHLRTEQEHKYPSQTLHQLVILSTQTDTDDSQRMITARTMFTALHPEYDVVLRNVSHDKMLAGIAAGDIEADIVYLSFTQQNDFVQNELYEDLSIYPQIAKQLDEHWINIGAMKDIEGRVFCLPDKIILEEFSSLLFVSDRDALAEAGISLPESGVTYDEFRILAQQAKDAGYVFLAMDNSAKHILDTYSVLYPQQNGGTSEMHEMLTFWMEMRDAGYVVFTDDVDDAGALLTCACGSIMDVKEYSISLHPVAVTNGDYMYFPNKGGAAKAAVPMWAWFMPRNGSQKDISADFLACIASLDAQSRLEQGIEGGMVLADIRAYRNWRKWTWQQVRGFDAFPGLNANGYGNWVELMENSMWMPWLPMNSDQTDLFLGCIIGDAVADKRIAGLNDILER